MKKLIAIALIAIMVLGLAACGTINKTEVSVLWSGDGIVKVPNSLINSLERAMYIENVSYKHYGANGNAETQLNQVESALSAGCSALVVELVDASTASVITEAAKYSDVPVIFINCSVDNAIVSSYNKCVCVDTSVESLPKVQADQIVAALVESKTDSYKKGIDRNNDGKITYAADGDVADVVAIINAALAEKNLSAMEAASGELQAVISSFTEDAAAAELIITTDDAAAMDALVALQAKDYNTNRLTTHCIPLFTVGDSADYKALVLADRPEGAHDDEAVQEYYISKQYIVDLSTVEEADLESMIYTTSNIIEDGRIAGSAIVDYDGIAVSAAAALADLLKGKTVETQIIKVDYTTI